MPPKISKQTLEYVNRCPLCFSENVVFLTKRGDGLPVYQCKDCSFAFLYKRPSQEVLTSYYGSDYFQDSETYQDYFNYAQAIVDLQYCPRLQRLRKHLSDFRGKRILDVGCAAGGTLALLKEKGAEVLGIEISEAACKIAREQYNIEVLNCPIEEANLNNDFFDVIFLFDVLEHLKEPAVALERLHGYLVKDGYLAITVPNFDRFFDEGSQWVGLQSYWEHLGYFRSEVICEKLTELGFSIIEVHTYGSEDKNVRMAMMKKVQRKIRDQVPVFKCFFRWARKRKFSIIGEPNLDVRYDGSGMNLFVLARKK